MSHGPGAGGVLLKLQRTRKIELFRELTLHLLELAGAMESKAGEWTRPQGQTPSRWKVLTAAYEKHTVPQIARRMGLSRQAVQKIANTLVAEGLVEFLENPDHKTSPIVQPTAKGRGVDEAITQGYIEWANRFVKGLDAETLAVTSRTLKTLADRLGRDKPNVPLKKGRG